MIYIVDGTGCINDGDYAVSMAGSHCNMIHYLNKDASRYWRGPNAVDIGQSTSKIAIEVYNEIMSNEFPPALLAPGAVQTPKTPIYLVGYSRGGAAMVMVAKMLAGRKSPVAAMFLFDAVSRSTSGVNVDVVPGNVVKCYHAIRNEGAEVVMEFEERKLWKKCQQTVGFNEVSTEYARVGSGLFEDFLLHRSARFPELHRSVKVWKTKSETLKKFRFAMRNSFELEASLGPIDGLSAPFENCAKKGESISDWNLKEFAGSHAALGGVPWETLGDEIKALDREASQRVWTWMSGNMLQSGIRVGKV